jgi:sRNA-binding protein
MAVLTAEEQTTEAIVTAVAKQITISEPQPDFADQQAIIAELAKLYPQTFFVDTKQRKPLMIGIFHQLIAAMPEMTKKRLRYALRFYCNHFDYLTALSHETHRIDLNGEPIEEISQKDKKSIERRLNKFNLPKNKASESNMAEREKLTLKRKPATTENKSSPVKPTATGDKVNASAKSAKITLVLDTASITRINSEGKKQVQLVVQVCEMKFTAELNSKSYRKALATIDELGADNCNAILQGYMPKFGVLEGVGLVVQPKKAKEEPIAEPQT